MSTWGIARHAIPRRGALLVPLLWGMAGAGSAIGLLATSAWLITRAAEAPPILYLTFAVVGVRAFALGRAVFRYLERVSSHNSALTQLAALRVWMFERFLPLAPAGVRGSRTGGLLTTLVRDVDTLQDLPLRIITPVGSALAISGVAIASIATVSPLAAVVLVLMLALAVGIQAILHRVVADRAQRELAPARSSYAGRVLETYRRRRILEAFDHATAADRLMVDQGAGLARLERSIAWGAGASPGVHMIVTGVATAAIATVAAPLHAAGEITGPLLAVLILTPLVIFETLQVVSPALAAWSGVASSAERIEETLPADLPMEIPGDDAPEPDSPVIPIETFELEDFQAMWPGASHPAFRPVSARLQAGDRVWISGDSGAGKTTLAYALVRFLDYRGSYTLNGEQAREYSADRLRRSVVLCEQTPHLFDASIRANLSFAKPDATDAELTRVLQRVGLGGWVRERGGLDQPVGERGALVSGGQAQRIALARALLADAPVIVFDEPTANVERQLADRLISDLIGAGSHRARRIVLVISHTPLPAELVTHRLTIESVER